MSSFDERVEQESLFCGDCGHTPTAAELAAGDLNDPESDDPWCPKCKAHNFKEKLELRRKPNEVMRRNKALNAKPFWANELVQFPRLLAEVYAVIDPDDVARMAEPMDLSVEQIKDLFNRADKRWEGIKERNCPGEPCECEEGDGCLVPGVLFPCSTDGGLATVERCDMCSRYAYDDEAASELFEMAMRKGYTFANYLLPGMKWEDAGAMHLVLMKVCEDTPDEQYLVPQTIEQAEALYKELMAEKPATCRNCSSTSLDKDGDCLSCGESREGYDDSDWPRVCPKCGGTSLDVQLPAVFRWNGTNPFALGPESLSSCEFPIEENAFVVCNGTADTPCDHTCKVKDLAYKK